MIKMDQSRRDKVSKVVNKAYKNQALRNHLIQARKGANNLQVKAVVFALLE